MASKKFNIAGVSLRITFRHKWDKLSKKSMVGTYNRHFPDYRLGLWVKVRDMVGKKEFNKPKRWKHNMVKSYMLGINLLVCKAWIDLDYQRK